MSKFEFEEVARDLPDDEIGVWTDGLCLSNDDGPLRAYSMEIGKKYRVTVELIDLGVDHNSE